ncbi:MAG: hypothetical protein ACFFG0_09115 [Candidatus Thorarchaeota archaeon]
MPKKITYPIRGMTIDEAEELIEKIYVNGSKIKRSIFAELINMKETGGAFTSKVSSLKKYGLIDIINDEILLTRLAKEIILTKDVDKKLNLLFESFNKIDLFKGILEKFRDVGRLNLDELDKNLQLEFGVSQNHVKPVKKSFIHSLNSLGILIKETGELDFSNIIEIDEKEDSQVIEKGKEFKNNQVSKSIPISYSNDVLDLIIYLSSHLDPMDIPIEEISDIIEKNENLSHIKYPFELEKQNIRKKSISQKKLKILLEALKQDLTQ